jgi:hypothetical protein
MQGHHLCRVIRYCFNFRALFDEQTRSLGLTEITGEVQGGEAVFRVRVESARFVEAFFEGFEATEGRGFKDVEVGFLFGDRFRQVAVAAIEGLHQEAYAVGIFCVGSLGRFFQHASEFVRISGLQQFEAALGPVHIGLPQVLSIAN